MIYWNRVRSGKLTFIGTLALGLGVFPLSGCKLEVANAPKTMAVSAQPGGSIASHEKFAILTSAGLATAGNCNGPYWLQSLDAGNSPITLTASATASLTNSGSAAFYSDSSCASPSTSASIPAGSSQSSGFYVMGNVAESLNVSAIDPVSGLSSDPYSIVLQPAPVSQLKITGSAMTTAGLCSGPFNIRSYDSFDNLSNVASDTAVSLSTSATGQFYSDSGCGSSASTVTLASGTSLAIFYYRDMVSGAASLSGAASGLTGTGLALNVGFSSANKLVFSIQPSASATAGVNFPTQPVVRIEDAFGNTVSNSTHPVLLTAYSDASCSTSASGLLNGTNNPTSASAGIAAFTGVNYTQSGALYLRASSNGLTSACSVLVTVSPASASKLAFGVQPSAMATAGSNFANQPSVSVLDNWGNLVSAGVHSVQLTAFSDAICTVPAAGTLNANANPLSTNAGVAAFSATRYLNAETIYLQASAPGLASVCSSQINVAAAAPTKLVLSSPSSIAAGICSGPYAVSSFDSFGNISNVSANTTVSLSSSSAGQFFSDLNCNLPVSSVSLAAGTSAASYYYKDSTAGSHTITNSATGFLPATLSVSVNPTAAGKLAFSVQPSSTAIAGSGFASQPRVLIQDVNGNTISTATDTVMLSAYIDPSCSIPATGTLNATANPVSATAGVASFSGVSFTKSGPLYLKAASGILASACSNLVSVSAASASKLAFSIAPPSSAAAGSFFSTQPAVSIQDSFGNFVSSATNAISLSAYLDANCTMQAGVPLNVTANPKNATSGTAAFSGVSYSEAGSIYLGATSAGLSKACSSVISVSPGAASTLVFSIQPPSTAVAGAVFSSQPVVKIQDSFGNDVSSSTAAITLAAYSDASCSVPASGSLSASTNPLNASLGTASFSAVSYTGLGNIYLGASANGLTQACSTMISVSSGSASKLAFSAQPGSGIAGSAFSIQPAVQVLDSFGNFVSSATNSITLIAYSDATCSTTASGVLNATANPKNAVSGVATFSGVSYSKSGMIYLRASSPGLNPVCSTGISVVAGSASRLVFSTSPSSSVIAGSNFAVQPAVSVQDASGNLVSSATHAISLAAYSDSACSTLATGSLSAASNPKSATAGVAAFSGVSFTDVGTIYLGASATGLSSACSSAISVSAGAASKLVLSGPTSIPAGSCSAAFTVESQDVNGNPSNLASSTTVSLSDNGSGVFYSNSTCSTNVNSVTIFGGNNSRTFYFKDNTAENVTLTASATGLTSSSLLVSVGAGAASKLVLSGPSSVTAGSCSAAFTVASQDASGNSANVSSNTSVSLSDNGSGIFYSNSTCSTNVNSVTISGGSSSRTFYFKDNTAENVTLTAAATGFTSGSISVSVRAGSPTKLAITGPASVNAGSCSAAFTVESQDANGNPSNVSANTSVSLSDNGSGVFYSNSTCSTNVNSVTISGGSSSRTFYFKDNTAENVTLTAAATGLTSGSISVSVRAGSATKLAITGPASVNAGSCSAAFTVESQDANGNPSNVSANTSVSLSDNGSGIFYSNSTCSTNVNSVTISGGSSSRTFYFKDSNAGSNTLTASATGLTSGGLNITVNAGVASSLAFSVQPSSAASAGSNFATQPVVSIEDSLGNLVTSATNSITLAAYSDAGCTNPASGGTLSATSNPRSATGGSASFSGVKFSAPGTIYLGASATGLSRACSSAINVSGGAPAKLMLVIPTSVPAGTCSSDMLVYTADSFNNVANVTTNTSVSLSNNAGGKFYSDAGCNSQIVSVTITSGTSSKTYYFKSSNAGSSTITNSATGLTSVSLPISVTGSSASRLAFTTQPSSSATAGSTLTVQPAVTIQDSSGAKVSNATNAITISAYRNASCTTGATGLLSVTTNPLSATSGVAAFSGVKYNTAETIYLKATSGSLTSACSSAISVAPGAATTLFFATQPSSTAVVNTVFATQPVVEIQDAYGNVVTSATNSITLNDYSNSSCSNSVSGSLSAASNPRAATGGIASFSGVKYDTERTIYIRASSSGLSSDCSSAVVVSASGGVPTWRAIASGSANAPSARYLHTAVWTGTQMIVWGGIDSLGGNLSNGGIFDPATSSWTAISSGVSNTPSARAYHTAIWTGSRMLIWGGLSTGALGSGASFDPATKTWRTMTTSGDPSARWGHTAVWTGTDMIIWGGTTGSGPQNDGRMYDPSNNSWSSVSSSGLTARTAHTAVWTGTRMIIWGGTSGSTYLNDGAVYNPGSNSWSLTSTGTGTPEARYKHTAVWAGGRMVVWGGLVSNSGVDTAVATGGDYDPSTDSWSAIPANATNEPGPRYLHAAISDGSKMYVWAGHNLTTAPRNGGIYDPSTQNWTAISGTATNVPFARYQHSAVWAGTEMIVWGGIDNNNSVLDDGGIFTP